VLTGVVELDKELGKEAGGAHNHERRTPEEGREPLEERVVEVQVVCDNDGEGDEPRGVGVRHGVGVPLTLSLSSKRSWMASAALLSTLLSASKKLFPQAVSAWETRHVDYALPRLASSLRVSRLREPRNRSC